MKAEKRGDKYFQILSDGEEEITEQEFKQVQKLEKLQIHIEKGLKHSKNKSWTAGNVPKELDSIIEVDIFIEGIAKSIDMLYKDGAKVYGLVEAVESMIEVVESDIDNSLEQDSLNVNKYYRRELKRLLRATKNLSPRQQSTKEDLSENTEPNNLTTSTIEDWLFEFKERGVLTEPHYKNLVNALTHYFENEVFPKLEETIKVGRVNKKLLGWHLNRIFHSEGKGVEIDLLKFAKESISTFKDVEFDEKDIQNSNLYKYFTTKTK